MLPGVSNDYLVEIDYLIKTIYLDLDDCLNIFTPYVLSSLGCSINALHYSEYKHEWGWDIVEAATQLHPKKRFSARSFWKQVSSHIWADAPLSDLFSPLIQLCQDTVGWENTYIATTPSLDPESASAKLSWINKNLPYALRRNYFLTPHKFRLANSKSLLIDDNEDNTIAWKKNNGISFLVPRPWNSLHNSSFVARRLIPKIEKSIVSEVSNVKV